MKAIPIKVKVGYNGVYYGPGEAFEVNPKDAAYLGRWCAILDEKEEEAPITIRKSRERKK